MLQAELGQAVQERYVFILVALAILVIALLGAVYYFYVARRRGRFRLPEQPRGSIILVEGPIDSRKGVLCYERLKAELEAGGKVGIISMSPNEHAMWFERNVSKELMARVKIIEGTQNLTDLGVLVTDALNFGATALYLPLLSVLLVNERLENIMEFIRFNAEKTRPRGVTVLFTLDPEITSKTSVSSIEQMMDCVVELRTEGGEFVRVKKLLGGEPETEWKPL